MRRSTALMSGCCGLPRRKETFVVRTTCGEVEGARSSTGNVIQFFGIPYAAPPVGPLRFKKPVAHEPWTDRRPCLKPGRIAVQTFPVGARLFVPKPLAVIMDGFLALRKLHPRKNHDWQRPQKQLDMVSEDCLVLNVETPSLKPQGGKLLPVMVWIHGGSFMSGTGTVPKLLAPESPLPATGQHVLVTIQYRLGVLGFMKVEGGDYNVGLWDQVAALRWVRENISGFGGDPNNVTIAGQSAGGMSCGALITSPHCRGLFHKAILMSGALQPAVSKDEHDRTVTQQVAAILGQPSCSVGSLRGLSEDQLMSVQVLLMERCGQREVYEACPLVFQPVADGELIPIGAKTDRVPPGVPVLVGYTRDEDALFRALAPSHFLTHSLDHLKQRLADLVGEDDGPAPAHVVEAAIQELRAWPDSGRGFRGDNEWTTLFTLASGLFRFGLPCHVAAEAVPVPSQAYLYRVDACSPSTDGLAAHGVDLPYMIGTHMKVGGSHLPRSKKYNQIMHEQIVRAWCSFVATGQPDLPGWVPFREGGGGPGVHAVMVLDGACTRMEVLEIEARLPTLYRALKHRRRPLFWLPPQPSSASAADKQDHGAPAVEATSSAQ